MTKQNLTINSINLIPIETDTGSDLYSGLYSGLYFDFYIDAKLLVKRVTALIKYSSELESQNTAEKHAREISTLLKTVKEILAHNRAIIAAEASAEQTYSLDDDEALAAELAELIVKNGGVI